MPLSHELPTPPIRAVEKRANGKAYEQVLMGKKNPKCPDWAGERRHARSQYMSINYLTSTLHFHREDGSSHG